MPRQFYTYLILISPPPAQHGPPVPIWVGKGSGDRVSRSLDELTTSTNKYLRAAARRALREHRRLTAVIYETFDTEEAAFAGEVALIARFGRLCQVAAPYAISPPVVEDVHTQILPSVVSE